MRRAPGFTLVELMVTITILGGVLLLVPTNIEGFGARSSLLNAGNMMVGVVGATQSQSIFDGSVVHLEIGSWRDVDNTTRYGYRHIITNRPAERSQQLRSQQEEEQTDQRLPEREWLTTNWQEFPFGIVVSAVSEQEGDWRPIREERPYSIQFSPDGSVERAFAVRLMSERLEVKDEFRTVTVVINGLTVDAASYEGYAEVPKQREESDFGR